MHLNKILEQIKRHQSPSEAIDKLSTALEKHEDSLLEKGFTIPCLVKMLQDLTFLVLR
jgi:hypothetical protein